MSVQTVTPSTGTNPWSVTSQGKPLQNPGDVLWHVQLEDVVLMEG